MAGTRQSEFFPVHFVDRLVDFCVTMVCWTYFTLGFIVFFAPFYCIAYLFVRQRQTAFQYLANLFYRGFFQILRVLAPRHQWRIDRHAAEITSAVIVSNHLSYLDPLLMISLFRRQKSVVKTRFFKMPIFGWVIRHTGYLPSDSRGRFTRMMLDQVEQMAEYLAGGGNLFVFPEGTRSRNGKAGPFNRGALKIARLCRAPIYVLRLAGTEKLFPPGRFLFNSRQPNIISLAIVDCLEPEFIQQRSLAEVENRIRQALGFCE